MSFEAKDYQINSILNKVVFSIPRNQRRYVWDQNNWQDLFEDILFSVEQDTPHFIGSIVLEKDGEAEGLTHFTIIDGQQRLASITLLLVAIMKNFLELNMLDDFQGMISYLRSTDIRNRKYNILSSDYNVSISHLVDGILYEEPEFDAKNCSISAFANEYCLSTSRDKKVREAIIYFYDAIKQELDKKENISDKAAALRDIRRMVLTMTAVKIESSEEDSYTIFEILNARGTELQSSDLVKNFIMRYIRPLSERDSVRATWAEMEDKLGKYLEHYIKHYVTHRYGSIENYRSPYHAIEKLEKRNNIERLLGDIQKKAEYYDKLVHPSKGDDGNCTELEYAIFSYFYSNRFEQFRPILLSLMHQQATERLSNEEYERVLRYIYNFFVCYTLIGEEKSNKLNDLVIKYAPKLENDYSDQAIVDFVQVLKDKMPNREWFLQSFSTIGYSNHFSQFKGKRNKRRAKAVLEILEKSKSHRDSVEDFSIEHALPDADGIQNSQIGNLIPLENSLNRNLLDKPLDEKLETYAKSNFATARNFAARYSDGTFSPENRTKILGEWIYDNVLRF